MTNEVTQEFSEVYERVSCMMRMMGEMVNTINNQAKEIKHLHDRCDMLETNGVK